MLVDSKEKRYLKKFYEIMKPENGEETTYFDLLGQLILIHKDGLAFDPNDGKSLTV